MPKKLTTTDINELYAFTQSRGVEYYDLQCELVDHLATDVEEQWAYNQNTDIESAVNAAYSRFDKTGFTTLVEQRKKALGKRYMKLIGKCFIGFFTPPKILFTIALFFAWYYLMDYEPVYFGFVFIVMHLAFTLKAVLKRNSYKGRIKESGKKWLLEELIYSGATIFGFLGWGTQVWMQAFRNNPGESLFYILPVMATLITLHNYIVLYAIPAKAKQYLKETYPEYGLA